MHRLLAGFFMSATMMAAALPAFADDYVDFLKREHGTLGKSEASQVLDVVRRADPTQGSKLETAQHFSALASIDPVTGAVMERSTMPGVMSVIIGTRPDWHFNATLRLLFDNVADRSKFVTGLAGAFGAPDPACLDDKIAYFSPAAGYTVSWLTPDPESPEAQLEIQGRDPPDANCARSSAPKDFLLNEADLATYLERLRDDAPPLEDLDAIKTWLTAYGEPVAKNEGNCDIDLILPSWDADPRPALAGLEGFHYIDASVAPCAGNNPKVNYVAITAHNGADMFGMGKAVAVATELYGEPADDCGEPSLFTWELDGTRTVMITEMNRSFAVVHYDTLLEEHDC
ncbi:MAG: hypothetical protein P0Y65_12420 [Candidatus Devosia phytovorans]|uniref:Uncharacterized protein n=1 Tax=Candidatus Devosia phytovorans TaxID=3121372 RepID=A0AAJ6AZB4_9HYPH|nr:hypothetical protein [Devosia sp.]WEK03009.1 MAG: hypothetical protein P0Y65_12420 [Devosia sp.]